MLVNPQPGQDSERVVLAGIIRDPSKVPIAIQALEAEDFGVPRSRELFRLVQQLDSGCSGSSDPVTVAQAIESRGLQDQCGDREQLRALLDELPSNAYLEPHIKQVKEASKVRRASGMFQSIAERVADGRMTGEEALRCCGMEHVKLLEKFERTGPRRIGDINRDYRKQIGKRRNFDTLPGVVTTPFEDLNGFMPCNGFGPGNLVVVAAGTGMGKTALTLQLAEHAARLVNVLFFTLEMTSEEVLQRYYAREASGLGRRIGMAHGKLVDPVLEATNEASNELHRSNLFLCDEPTLTMEKIRAHTLAIHRTEGVGAIFIDYLQLVKPPSDKVRRTRAEEVGGMSRTAKLLAKEIGCPVVLAAQLNRAQAGRPDPTPILSDIRESGSIEQDADVVLMLHRPSHLAPESTESDRIYVRKNRQGETGAFQVDFNGPTFSWKGRPAENP
jgi:replicative DNA helicase